MTKRVDSNDPANWTDFIRAGWVEWREAVRDHGADSREARWAKGRFLDRKVAIETNPATRKFLTETAMMLLHS